MYLLPWLQPGPAPPLLPPGGRPWKCRTCYCSRRKADKAGMGIRVRFGFSFQRFLGWWHVEAPAQVAWNGSTWGQVSQAANREAGVVGWQARHAGRPFQGGVGCRNGGRLALRTYCNHCLPNERCQFPPPAHSLLYAQADQCANSP